VPPLLHGLGAPREGVHSGGRQQQGGEGEGPRQPAHRAPRLTAPASAPTPADGSGPELQTLARGRPQGPQQKAALRGVAVPVQGVAQVVEARGLAGQRERPSPHWDRHRPCGGRRDGTASGEIRSRPPSCGRVERVPFGVATSVALAAASAASWAAAALSSPRLSPLSWRASSASTGRGGAASGGSGPVMLMQSSPRSVTPFGAHDPCTARSGNRRRSSSSSARVISGRLARVCALGGAGHW
jgi:hypothetical protein